MSVKSGSKSEKYSVDAIPGYPLYLRQPVGGYRFSMDTLVLAGHVCSLERETVLDIGTGCGILPIVLAHKYPGIRVFGVEIQKTLAGFARENCRLNRLDHRITIIETDIAAVGRHDISGNVDVIVSNPPFTKQRGGRLNPESGKAVARHEITLTLDLLCRAAGRLLREKGVFYMIFPADRLAELILELTRHHLFPRSFCFVHTRKEAPAKRVMIESIKIESARATPAGCTVQPPIVMDSRPA